MPAFLAPLVANPWVAGGLAAGAGALARFAPQMGQGLLSAMGGVSSLPAYFQGVGDDNSGGGGDFDLPQPPAQPAPSAPAPPVTLQDLGIDLPQGVAPSFVPQGTGMIDLNALTAAYQPNPDVLGRFDSALDALNQRGVTASEEIARQMGFGESAIYGGTTSTGETLPGLAESYRQTYEDYVQPQFANFANAVMGQVGGLGAGTGGTEALQAAMAANRQSRESLIPLLGAGLGERATAQTGRLNEVLAGLTADVEAGRTGYLGDLSTSLAGQLASAQASNAALAAQQAEFNAQQRQRANESAQSAKQFKSTLQAGLQEQQAAKPPSFESLVAAYRPTPSEVSAAAGASLAAGPDSGALRNEIYGNPRTLDAYTKAREAFAGITDPSQLAQVTAKLRKKYPKYSRTLSLAMWDTGIRPSLEELAGLGG